MLNSTTVTGVCQIELTEDGVGRVQRGLVHGSVANEPGGIGERNAGRREEIPLVVRDDLAGVVAPHGHTRVGRSQIDADRRSIARQRRHLHSWIRRREDKYCYLSGEMCSVLHNGPGKWGI